MLQMKRKSLSYPLSTHQVYSDFFNISPEHFYVHKTSTFKKNLLKKIICFLKSRCFTYIKMFLLAFLSKSVIRFVNFCTWCQVPLGHGYQIVQAPFVEKTAVSLLNCLGNFVKSQFTVNTKFYLQTFNFVPLSSYAYPYRTVLITVAL